jgi:predicted NBD/HSP70 family sugar kinase
MTRAPRLYELAAPRIVSPLQPHFRPAALAHRAFAEMVHVSGGGEPLVIAIERDGGAVSRYETVCLNPAHPESVLNLELAERLVKLLLWARGGWRLVVGGPSRVGEHVRAALADGGTLAFDAAFMADVYSRPFAVEVTTPERVPAAHEPVVALGGHLDGCRIGFDLGASDRKAAAVIDGEAVYAEEVVWDPRNATDPVYHFDELMRALHSAAAHLPRVDAIGGSAAGIYIDNRPRVASLFRGIPRALFETRTVNLFADLQRAWHGVPFAVVNDGDVSALAGAMSLRDAPVLGLAFGSSEAAGYVTAAGAITTWLNELAFPPIDYAPEAPVDEWSGARGVGAVYLSQQAVFRLADGAGIPCGESSTPAARLKGVQRLLEGGDPRARAIWEAIGISLGYALAHYATIYELKHVPILGRVTSGSGGEIILARASEVLAAEFPELAARLHVALPDEKSRRVGQAVAAASLPRLDRRLT